MWRAEQTFAPNIIVSSEHYAIIGMWLSGCIPFIIAGKRQNGEII